MSIPTYAPSVPEWIRLAANALNPIIRRFNGSGTYQQEDLPGFTYTPDLEHINYADSLGSTDNPVTDVDPVVLISKNSLTGDIGGGVNPALVVQHNHFGTDGEARAQAAYLETVVRTGGASVFGEALRAHCFVPDGIVGKANTALFFAYNGGTGLNAVPVEAEVRRGTSTDCPVGRSYVSSSQLDAAFCATAHTVDGAVGSTGGKPVAAFYVNPFSSKAVQTGFWVPKTVVSGQTVAHTAFGCQEVGLTYGLDLAKGTYSTAAIALPNNSKVTAYNAAGSTELEILKLDGSNVLQVAGDASGLGIKELAAASVPTPAAGYQTLFIDTADHKLKRKDSAGTVTIIA